MGLQDLFGGSSQKSESGNKAYPWVSSTFGPAAGSDFNGASSALGGLLGLPGGDPQALQKFWNSSGGQFFLNQGTNNINANMYARGLGQSGADMKALENYRSNLASTQFQNLFNDYLGLGKLGLGAGDLVSNAGQFSKGSGSSSSGQMGQDIAMLAAAFL